MRGNDPVSVGRPSARTREQSVGRNETPQPLGRDPDPLRWARPRSLLVVVPSSHGGAEECRGRHLGHDPDDRGTADARLDGDSAVHRSFGERLDDPHDRSDRSGLDTVTIRLAGGWDDSAAPLRHQLYDAVHLHRCRGSLRSGRGVLHRERWQHLGRPPPSGGHPEPGRHLVSQFERMCGGGRLAHPRDVERGSHLDRRRGVR